MEQDQPEEIRPGKPPHRQGPGTHHDPIKKTGRFKTVKEGRNEAPTLADGRAPGAGRPRKLTPELISHLASLVAEGCPAEIVRAAAGVTTKTWHNWSRDAEQGDELAQELFEVMEQAEGIGNYQWWQKWRDMTNSDAKNWMAAATYLERRLPDLFARPDRWRGDAAQIQVSASNALEEASKIVFDSATLAITNDPQAPPVPPVDTSAQQDRSSVS